MEKGHLDLPLRDPASGPEWVFPPPDSDPPRATRVLREPGHVRRTESDLTTGLVHLVIEDDFGMVEDCGHGGAMGSVARERWTIHPDNSLSAKGNCHWTEETGRDGIRLRTETSCEMWSDATHFHLTERQEAYEIDRLICERELTDRIARDNL